MFPCCRIVIWKFSPGDMSSMFYFLCMNCSLVGLKLQKTKAHCSCLPNDPKLMIYFNSLKQDAVVLSLKCSYIMRAGKYFRESKDCSKCVSSKILSFGKLRHSLWTAVPDMSEPTMDIQRLFFPKTSALPLYDIMSLESSTCITLKVDSQSTCTGSLQY